MNEEVRKLSEVKLQSMYEETDPKKLRFNRRKELMGCLTISIAMLIALISLLIYGASLLK